MWTPSVTELLQDHEEACCLSDLISHKQNTIDFDKLWYYLQDGRFYITLNHPKFERKDLIQCQNNDKLFQSVASQISLFNITIYTRMPKFIAIAIKLSKCNQRRSRIHLKSISKKENHWIAYSTKNNGSFLCVLCDFMSNYCKDNQIQNNIQSKEKALRLYTTYSIESHNASSSHIEALSMAKKCFCSK